MLNKTIGSVLALGLAVGLTSQAAAQEGTTTFFDGLQVIAVGDPPAFDSNPSSQFDPEFHGDAANTNSRMYNDGSTAGDVSATDNIWTWTATGLTASGDPLGLSKMKMATWDGAPGGATWGAEAPSGGDANYPTDATEIKFLWVDTDGSTNDGWLPDNNYIYSDPFPDLDAILAARTAGPYIWGNFIEELGGPGNWGDAADYLEMTDGDDDGTWEVELSGWQSKGVKEFKAVINNAWGTANEFGSNGYGGGNIQFFVLKLDDVVTFKVRESDGRHQFEGLTPLPSTDGVYAIGPWTDDPETDSVMTPTANGYEGTFTVPAAGQHTLTIIEITTGTVTQTWPGQGSHPFKTTTADQDIRVNLQTASMGDGAVPDSNFIYTDPASRIDFTSAANGRIQLVGFLGLWGTRYSPTSGDWDVPATDSVGSNDPVGTQVSGDPYLYRWDAPTTDHGDPSGIEKQWKAVAETDDIPSASSSDIQIGGVVDNDGDPGTTGDRLKCGLVLLGDNQNPEFTFADATDYTFFIDTATGRTLVGETSSFTATPNLRPLGADNPVGASVSEWQQY